MRAVITRQEKLVLGEAPAPEPKEGQALVRTLTCGICGTDLHALHHMRGFLAGLARSGGPLPTDPTRDMIFGHEFCAEILDYGPNTNGALKRGARVVALPYVSDAGGSDYVGYSNVYPGGFAEQMVLTARLMMAVPNGLSADLAALTEPFSVGAHAVARAGDLANATIMVVGCGPIGLAVIAALKARGAGPVIGMDFSSARRLFAERLGADEIIDPAVEPAAAVWARHGAGGRGRRAIAFECVGRPGAAQGVIETVPRQGLVVVVGNALEACTIDQVMAFNKELDIRFSLNYSREEFERTLHDIAEGRIKAQEVLTGVVAPEQVPQAFEDLKNPEKHAKIIVKFG